MRLDKFVSHATDLSRAQVKRAIKCEQVAINGIVALSPQQKVSAEDCVTFEGEKIFLPSLRYLMVNKPVGCVSATTDSENTTILDVIGESDSNLSIAGRLDKDTTGLMLLSDDGQWVHNVTSPRKRCAKTYIASLDKPVGNDVITRFAEGIQLRSETSTTLPAKLVPLEGNNAKVEIFEGKYHQVKRMFSACGIHVLSLHRHAIGDLVLDPSLAPGEFRALTAYEINRFK